MTTARTDPTTDTRNETRNETVMPTTPHTRTSRITPTTRTTGDVVDATTDDAAGAHRPAGNNGILAAARLNLVGSPLRLAMPWLVGAAGFLISYVAFFLAATNSADDGGVTGALASLYISAAIAYLQTMTQTFGFALSLGVTRRNFFLGIGIVVVGESFVHAVLLTLLRMLETATGGWGLDMRFFGIPLLAQDNPFAQLLAYGGLLVGLAFLALLTGIVFQRWGQIGIYTAGIGIALVLGALGVLVTWLGAWSAVGAFFVAIPGVVLFGVVPLVIAALAGLVGYLLVRRATP